MTFLIGPRPCLALLSFLLLSVPVRVQESLDSASHTPAEALSDFLDVRETLRTVSHTNEFGHRYRGNY